MQTDSVRKRKLAILKRRKVDVRAEINWYGSRQEGSGAMTRLDDLVDEERKIEQEISILQCVRLDLL